MLSGGPFRLQTRPPVSDSVPLGDHQQKTSAIAPADKATATSTWTEGEGRLEMPEDEEGIKLRSCSWRHRWLVS